MFLRIFLGGPNQFPDPKKGHKNHQGQVPRIQDSQISKPGSGQAWAWAVGHGLPIGLRGTPGNMDSTLGILHLAILAPCQ